VAKADACLQAARGLWEPPSFQEPHQRDSKVWLATTKGWEADLASRRGHYAQAMNSYWHTYTIWQDLTYEYPADVILGQHEAENYWSIINLISTSPAREDTLPLLEENRVLLTSLVQEAPSSTILRKRLAFTWLLLAEAHKSNFEELKALPCWQQAHEHYIQLAGERHDDLLVNLSLGRCCYQLIRDQHEGPYYREAVALYEKEGIRLAASVESHPEADWLREALLENYCTLALCYWKTGHAALGEQVIQNRVRRMIALPREYSVRSTHDLSLLNTLIHLGIGLREVNQREAALALAREAGLLADRYAMMPVRDLWFRRWLVSQAIPLAALLRQLGAPAEALRYAEQSRNLSEEHCRTEPDNLWSLQELSEIWAQIGKAHWDLHQPDKALAALREAAAVQRKVVDLAPSVRATRISLSKCYDRLFDRNRLSGNLTDAATALLEREKLWPDDAAELKRVARNFVELANAVSMRPGPLSSAEQLERQGYLDQYARVIRKSDKAATSK
jgi:tetratricopeptide (TPR) repeat protein